MKAMVLDSSPGALVQRDLPVPSAGEGEILLRVAACGVCRTDLHIVDGELPDPNLPLIPGHEVVGEVVACGEGAGSLQPGERVGVPWLGGSCGHCEYCSTGKENLCEKPQFTGYSRNGGFAEYAVADAAYCFKIPEKFGDAEAAPLLCAGLIGFRSLRSAGAARRLGLYGFGAAAHIIAQVAVQQGREVFAFTRPGDLEGQNFAKEMGAAWSGGSDEEAPQSLDAAIIFAPVGALIPAALRNVRKGGRVVCAGIHMSDIPAFPYQLLWGERCICSVANLTREDGLEFFKTVAEMRIKTHVQTYPLEEANRALSDLRSGNIKGAAVLDVHRNS